MMLKHFYGVLIDSHILEEDLYKYIMLAKKYDKINPVSDDAFDEGGNLLNYNDEPVFFSVGDSKNEKYAVFFDNLFFVFTYDQDRDDYVTKIFLKKPDSPWAFSKVKHGNSMVYDVINPQNVIARIYIGYNLNILDTERYVGSKYENGSWNKYFYKTMMRFIDITSSYLELNQMAHAYGK